MILVKRNNNITAKSVCFYISSWFKIVFIEMQSWLCNQKLNMPFLKNTLFLKEMYIKQWKIIGMLAQLKKSILGRAKVCQIQLYSPPTKAILKITQLLHSSTALCKAPIWQITRYASIWADIPRIFWEWVQSVTPPHLFILLKTWHWKHISQMS